jgi:hypothetical protein
MASDREGYGQPSVYPVNSTPGYVTPDQMFPAVLNGGDYAMAPPRFDYWKQTPQAVPSPGAGTNNYHQSQDRGAHRQIGRRERQETRPARPASDTYPPIHGYTQPSRYTREAFPPQTNMGTYFFDPTSVAKEDTNNSDFTLCPYSGQDNRLCYLNSCPCLSVQRTSQVPRSSTNYMFPTEPDGASSSFFPGYFA